MTELEWCEYSGSDILRNKKTGTNVAWVKIYPDLGYSINVWNRQTIPQGDWECIAYQSDLETAKTIAMMYVKGNLI